MKPRLSMWAQYNLITFKEGERRTKKMQQKRKAAERKVREIGSKRFDVLFLAWKMESPGDKESRKVDNF